MLLKRVKILSALVMSGGVWMVFLLALLLLGPNGPLLAKCGLESQTADTALPLCDKWQQPPSGEFFVEINVDNTHVRKLPSLDAESLGIVKKGDSLPLIGSYPKWKWYKVKYKNGEGFVEKSVATINKPFIQWAKVEDTDLVINGFGFSENSDVVILLEGRPYFPDPNNVHSDQIRLRLPLYEGERALPTHVPLYVEIAGVQSKGCEFEYPSVKVRWNTFANFTGGFAFGGGFRGWKPELEYSGGAAAQVLIFNFPFKGFKGIRQNRFPMFDSKGKLLKCPHWLRRFFLVGGFSETDQGEGRPGLTEGLGYRIGDSDMAPVVV
ncbi:MAG: hypothetical protein AB1410_00205 [Acidobacteriota bacterium]